MSLFESLNNFPEFVFLIGSLIAGFLLFLVFSSKINKSASSYFIAFSTAVALLATLYSFVIRDFGMLPTAYTMILNFALCGLVFFQNPKSNINRTFCLMVTISIFWSLINYFSDNSLAYETAVFWNRMLFVVVSPIPVLFLLFSIFFPEDTKLKNSDQVLLIAFPAVVLAIFSIFTDFVVINVHFVKWGTTIDFGIGFILFGLFVISYVGAAFAILISKLNRYQGFRYSQIKYTIFGFLVSVIPAILANIIFPFMNNFSFTWIGPSLTLTLMALVAYPIIRHRLLSIELMIRRSLIYAISVMVIFGLYLLSAAISSKLFTAGNGRNSIVFSTLAVVILAMIYQPIQRIVREIVDRYYLKGSYDYQKVVQRISEILTTKIKLRNLSELIIRTIVTTINVSEASLLIFDPERNLYSAVCIPSKTIGSCNYREFEIKENNPIVKRLKENNDVLIYEELQNDDEIKKEMEELKLSFLVPVISRERLIGIISLGSKLSKDFYTYEDINLIYMLANQAAVVLENARLYENVVNISYYMQKILESMVAGVLTVDSRGEVLTFNPVAERITSLSSKEIVGKPYQESFRQLDEISAIIESALKVGTVSTIELNLVSPQKGLIPVSISSILLLDSKNRRKGVLISFFDLSEIKVLEKKLRRSEKMQTVATMARTMAHEIKNPLSSLKVFSQLLPIKYQDEEFRAKFLEIFSKDISRIDRIIESLLDFTKVSASKFINLNLENLLEENIAYHTENANKNSVKITKEYSSSTVIEGDHDQLNQLFSNLILNAIQAMPGGGEIRINLVEEGEEVVLSFKDNGPGMAGEVKTKLFEPFFTTKEGGTGLGLSIVHNVVEVHRGKIEVESEPGKGTTFKIRLPLSQSAVQL